MEYFYSELSTPNDDGKNPSFLWLPIVNNHFRMDIYNRWGNKLLTTSSPSWNGLIRSETVSSGVYYFEIQYSGSRVN